MHERWRVLLEHLRQRNVQRHALSPRRMVVHGSLGVLLEQLREWFVRDATALQSRWFFVRCER